MIVSTLPSRVRSDVNETNRFWIAFDGYRCRAPRLWIPEPYSAGNRRS